MEYLSLILSSIYPFLVLLLACILEKTMMISKSKSSRKDVFRFFLWIFTTLMLLLYVLTNYVELGPQVDSIN
jgi:MFS-type transporter involved in bile tolerance (Atg22 family)